MVEFWQAELHRYCLQDEMLRSLAILSTTELMEGRQNDGEGTFGEVYRFLEIIKVTVFNMYSPNPIL